MNFNIEFGVADNAKPAMFPDISEVEMFAIGKMTAAWAMLENLLILTTFCLADKYAVELPDGLPNSPFKDRLLWFNKTCQQIENERVRNVLEKIGSRIANVQTERHEFTHSLWEWTPENPAKVKTFGLKKKSKFIKTYDADKILQVAQKIGEINFDLKYPRGQNQMFYEKGQAGFSMSRKFAMMMCGKETSDPSLQLQQDFLDSNDKE